MQEPNNHMDWEAAKQQREDEARAVASQEGFKELHEGKGKPWEEVKASFGWQEEQPSNEMDLMVAFRALIKYGLSDDQARALLLRLDRHSRRCPTCAGSGKVATDDCGTKPDLYLVKCSECGGSG